MSQHAAAVHSHAIQLLACGQLRRVCQETLSALPVYGFIQILVHVHERGSELPQQHTFQAAEANQEAHQHGAGAIQSNTDLQTDITTYLGTLLITRPSDSGREREGTGGRHAG